MDVSAPPMEKDPLQPKGKGSGLETETCPTGNRPEEGRAEVDPLRHLLEKFEHVPCSGAASAVHPGMGLEGVNPLPKMGDMEVTKGWG